LSEHYTVPVAFDTNFQQDEAFPPHFGKIVSQFLNECFPNKWVGRYGFLA
jgi:hypothetical protein